MKKNTIQSLVSYLNGETVTNLDEIKAELEAELAKGQAKKEANQAAYAEYHDKVIEVLSGLTDPVTAQDIADETGIARGKISYAMKNYWADEIIADKSGKVTTYRLA